MSQLVLALCLVVGIADGDTLTARCGEPGAYQQVKVRLAGIDAPERRQAFGNRARQALADLCHQQQARIEPRSTDRYGRVVADVTCAGTDAGRHMVQGGWAWVFDRYAQQHQHLYPLQAEARAQRRGLWVDDATAAPPVPPWQWRRDRLTSSPSRNSLPRNTDPMQRSRGRHGTIDGALFSDAGRLRS